MGTSSMAEEITREVGARDERVLGVEKGRRQGSGAVGVGVAGPSVVGFRGRRILTREVAEQRGKSAQLRFRDTGERVRLGVVEVEGGCGCWGHVGTRVVVCWLAGRHEGLCCSLTRSLGGDCRRDALLQ